jgi:phosphoribosylformylglycinamidine (FGAM) synthase PurS component
MLAFKITMEANEQDDDADTKKCCPKRLANMP